MRTNRIHLGVERLEGRELLTGNWALEAMQVEPVWAEGYTGNGVVVAVVDSGIDNHPDLARNVWVNSDERPGNGVDDDGNGYIDDRNGWDFVSDDNSPLGANSHGTQVAGIIAAADNGYGVTGVAHSAKIMPIRVFSESGNGSTIDTAAAIRYAVDNGANVINLSSGGTATRSIELALEYAASKNVLVVAAAGNSAESAPVFPARYSATMTNVLSVGAHDQQYKRTSISNGVGATGAVQIDAPGTQNRTTTTDNEYAYTGGTSSAAAHVAGIAALALSADPFLSVGELRKALTQGVGQSVVGSDSLGAANARATLEVVLGGELQQADLDADGVVGFGDFLILARNFGELTDQRSEGDVDGDGKVRFADFILLVNSFGARSNSPIENPPSAEPPDTEPPVVENPVTETPTTGSDTSSKPLDEEGVDAVFGSEEEPTTNPAPSGSIHSFLSSLFG